LTPGIESEAGRNRISAYRTLTKAPLSRKDTLRSRVKRLFFMAVPTRR